MNISKAHLAAVLVALAWGCSAQAQAQNAEVLGTRYQSLRDRLERSPFQQPLLLESDTTAGAMTGDVYAVVDQPFPVASPALQGGDHWCDLLMLHLNVKDCRTEGPAGPVDRLNVVIGRKADQALADGFRVAFRYSLPVATDVYLRVQLDAPNGPLSTRDYRLALEAIPLDAGSTFIHMSYAYTYGTAAKFAMQTYLATLGRGKIGFSVVEHDDLGKPVYTTGVRGVLERNTMRYFLAIQAYLGALSSPAPERAERRLQDWFNATERYAAQLHELDRDDYLGMKRRELRRTGTAETH